MNLPSTIRVKSHDNVIVECRCLSCTNRQEFLRWRDEAWSILQEDALANRANDINTGIQHVFDSSEEFRWLCEQMLAAHGLRLSSLDIHQVIELLFISSDGTELSDGALVKIQFPPMPPGAGRQLEPDESPYYSLWASLAYASGNWLQAKETLDQLTYEEVIELSRHIEKVAKEKKVSTQNPASTVTASDNPLVAAKQESLMQKAKEARTQGIQKGIKEKQLEAIKKAIQEKANGSTTQ